MARIIINTENPQLKTIFNEKILFNFMKRDLDYDIMEQIEKEHSDIIEEMEKAISDREKFEAYKLKAIMCTATVSMFWLIKQIEDFKNIEIEND